MRLLTTFLLAVSSSVCLVPLASAFSSGAGGCSEGVPAVGPPHLAGGGSSTITNGTLEDGAITVLLDGTAISPETVASFAPGVNHTLTLQRDSGYKGLLFRLGGSVGTSALQVVDGSNLQVAGVCTSASASGITHKDGSAKTESNLTLYVESAVSSLPLDVTVVISNSGTSEFYYSRFPLSAVTLTTTPAPVAPTESTPAPTSMTEDPTPSPSVTSPTATSQPATPSTPIAPTTAPVAPTTAPVSPSTTAPAPPTTTAPVAPTTTAPVAPTTPRTSAGCGMSFAVVAALGLLTSTLSGF